MEESEEEKILVVGDTEKRCFNLTKRVRGNDKLQTTPGKKKMSPEKFATSKTPTKSFEELTYLNIKS